MCVLYAYDGRSREVAARWMPSFQRFDTMGRRMGQDCNMHKMFVHVVGVANRPVVHDPANARLQ